MTTLTDRACPHVADVRQAPTRITLVIPQAEPCSGMEFAARRLAELLREDFEIHVVILSGPAGAFDMPDTRVSLLDCGRRTWRLAVAAVKLLRFFRGRNGGLVVAVGLWGAVPVLLACRTQEVVVWEHSLSPWRIANDRRVRILVWLARRLYPRARHVVAVSDAAAAAASALIPDARTTYIPNLIGTIDADPTVASPATKGRPPRLLILGSLTPRKNTLLAIRALRFIDSAIQLDVAGDGQLRRRLEEEAARLGFSGRVNFLGHVDDPSDVIDRSDLVLHPALDETFGYALVEAAQHRRPVIALDRPNMNGLVPRFVPGILAQGEDPEAFAAAIRVGLEMDWPAAVFERATERLCAHHNEFAVRKAWVGLLVQTDDCAEMVAHA